MKIAEIFYSLQGEGARVGEPSIFIRLSGCDLACGFCDTEFESGKEMSIPALIAYISRWPCRWIVWTGGEPTLQLTAEIVAEFNRLGYRQAIETNGNHPTPHGLDWVACSPKVAEHVVKQNFPDGVDELRYVRHSGQPGIPQPKIKAKRLFLSPMFSDGQTNENLKHCVSLCLENPDWSVSVQMHKILKLI
jgi:organic radical activating enzyme